MPLTLNGNGAISGLGDIDGHDLETATLVVSGDTTIGPQAVGRATLFVDEAANRIGINTTTPGELVHISDGAPRVSISGTTDSIDIQAGVAAGIAFIGTISNDDFRLRTNNTSKVTIGANGTVGIGTTTPDATFTTTINALTKPEALLLERTAGGAGAGVSLRFRNSDNENWTIFNDGNAALSFSTDQGLYNTTTKFALNPSGYAVVNGLSRVQIYSAFDVFQENTNLANNFRAAAGIWDKTYSGENSGGSLDLGGLTSSTGTAYRTFAGIKGVKENDIEDDNSARLEFWTRGSGSTYTKRAAVTSAGNLSFYNAGGIDFSGTEGSGATSSILDDYEEGSWLPRYNGYTSGFSGRYTKIGRTVTLRVIRAGSFPPGTITSGGLITGLPYTPIGIGSSATECQYGGLLSGRANGSLSGGTAGLEIMPIYIVALTGILLFNQDSAWTSTMLPTDATGNWVMPANWQNGSTAVYINWEFTYQTDS